jgi:crotonobetainyl-CoA:carnitine CoA-transferase CaiB-like acyl-CoA transferase
MAGTQRLGLDYETLRQRYPRLIYAHLTAWGREGPMRDAPGYDAGAFWAATGMLDLMRESDAEGKGLPRLPGAAGDHATSLALVAGVGLALFNRGRTGQGRLVDVSLFRTGLWCNGMFLSGAAASPDTAQNVRDPARLGATFRSYTCRDGAVVQLLGYQPNRHAPALLRATGLAELPSDLSELDALFATKDAAEWEAIFDEEGVWYTRVMRFEDVLGGVGVAGGKMSQAARQAAETGAFLTGKSETRGFAVVASPISVGDGIGAHNEPPSGAQGTARAPLLAEHLDAVMAEAGVSADDMAEMKAQGAFGPQRPLSKI